MIDEPIITYKESKIELLKCYTKKFYEARYTEKSIDKQINEFVDKENVQIVDVKFIVDTSGTKYALLIYRKFEPIAVINDERE